jgi:hypothetical protein
MTRLWIPALFVPFGWAAVVVGQGPTETRANPENIAAALRLTQAATAEYDIRVGDDATAPPLELLREPILKWSNPDRGEVHGNVFLWTRGGRPFVVGSLYKWFTPHTHMSHEFQSLSHEPITASFHGQPVWKTAEAGVTFVDLPDAPPPASQDTQRQLQTKQLAKNFAGSKVERDDPKEIELRLLPQPIYRYAAPNHGVLSGGLFTLVHGTDPEIFVLIEARDERSGGARWKYAAARMNSVEVRLRYLDKQVWSAAELPWKDVHDHRHAYTTFGFQQIPDFLKDALARPKQ